MDLMGFRWPGGIKTEEANRVEWKREINSSIQALADQARPLNDHFARGTSITMGDLLRYVAALERRIEWLEDTLLEPDTESEDQDEEPQP